MKAMTAVAAFLLLPSLFAQDSKHTQTFALKAGHFEHILNVDHYIAFRVTADFPVTIRERGCLKRDAMDNLFYCKSRSDIYIYDQRPFFSIGAEPNVVTIDWDPKIGNALYDDGTSNP